MTELPLRGRRVLLTRPGGRGTGLAAILRSCGAAVEEHPAIAFESLVATAAVRAALERLSTYALVLFTSPTGVEHFFAGGVAGLPPAGALGPGTARALRAAGIEPVLVADGRAEELVEAVRKLAPLDRPLLVVRPEEGMDSVAGRLREAGIAIDAVAFYRTVAAPSAGAAVLRLVEGKVDALVLASPSALRALLDSAAAPQAAIREALARTGRVAIGPVTASALENEQLPAHVVAAEPTDDAVSRAVLALLCP